LQAIKCRMTINTQGFVLVVVSVHELILYSPNVNTVFYYKIPL